MAKAPPQNFYQVLGVSENATGEQLRESYLRLAKKFHPDKNPDHPQYAEHFKKISEAYAVLREPVTRARYDRLRKKVHPPKVPKPPVYGQAAPKSAASQNSAGPFQSQTQTQAKAKAEAQAQANAWAQAQARAQAQAQFKAQQDQARQAQAQANAKAQAKADSQAKTQNKKSEDSILENFLNQLFKSPAGRESLKKTQGELNKADLGVAFDRLSGRLFGNKKKKSIFSKAFGIVKDFFFSSDEPAETPKDHYDIRHNIAITPQVAKTGTAVTINFQRDLTHSKSLEINIPPNVKDQHILRIMGEGNMGPNQKRGDFILTVNILH